MDRFKFGPAGTAEPAVFGACRPGKSREEIAEWIAFMQQNGVARVCCVIPGEHLAEEAVDLLAAYRKAFGAANVLHAPVADFSLCDEETMAGQILPSCARQTPGASGWLCTAGPAWAGPDTCWPPGWRAGAGWRPTRRCARS